MLLSLVSKSCALCTTKAEQLLKMFKKLLEKSKQLARKLQEFGDGLQVYLRNQLQIWEIRKSKRPKKKEKVKFDEKAIYTEIGDQLVIFFKNFRDCAEAIRIEEENIEQIYDPDGETYERSIRLVIAKTQLEQMGADLTDYMIYHVPPDLKDLYTRVNDMIGTVKVKQELARKAEIRKKAIREAEAREAADRAWFLSACTVAVILVSIYMAGLMWAINRMTHGGM